MRVGGVSGSEDQMIGGVGGVGGVGGWEESRTLEDRRIAGLDNWRIGGLED